MVKPESFNECFEKWVRAMVPNLEGKTIALDGKTVRSTAKMSDYKHPLHIVSAQIADLGITLSQEAVEDKENEIPCVRRMLELLEITGCMVVADALHCQKETAAVVVEQKADYLLSVKGNQGTLHADIKEYVQDSALRKDMNTARTAEKNGGRYEVREAFITDDVDWLYAKKEWAGLASIGAIRRQFSCKDKTSDEWSYYISSRKLSAEELLKHARLEWSVESMHWLLDVHFREDFCMVREKRTQQNLNMIRKIVINSLRLYKDAHKSKAAFSHFMFECMMEPRRILDFCATDP
jgi:predicted transposase YbfD/YdcC